MNCTNALVGSLPGQLESDAQGECFRAQVVSNVPGVLTIFCSAIHSTGHSLGVAFFILSTAHVFADSLINRCKKHVIISCADMHAKHNLDSLYPANSEHCSNVGYT
jgi:hypothetical protein